ncbi:MAG: hypothetical protein HY904_02465 [Deltaproteobacteria bacterium]|nr:hypothetical protein [Deltaproteobacteria bacterium]
MAYDKAAAGASVRTDNATPGVSAGRRDPLYLELGNVEMGTRLEVVNLSKDPGASFGRDKLTLDFTGRDVGNRQAAVYLTTEQMEQMGIKPGDVLGLRAVDQAGNASGVINVEVQANEWANGHVVENGNWSNQRGASVSMLDGEGTRKNVIAKAVNDARPPLLTESRIRVAAWSDADRATAGVLYNNYDKLAAALGKTGEPPLTRDTLKQLAQNTTLPQDVRDAASALVSNKLLFANAEIAAGVGSQDGILGRVDLKALVDNPFTLVAPGALEPGAMVRVQNQRTGETFEVRRDLNSGSTLAVGLKNLQNGDPLVVTPIDNNGVQGQQVEVVFSNANKKGVAPKLKGGLSVRLPGAIEG